MSYVGNSSAIGDAPYWSVAGAAGLGGYGRGNGIGFEAIQNFETRRDVKDNGDAIDRNGKFAAVASNIISDKISNSDCSIKTHISDSTTELAESNVRNRDILAALQDRYADQANRQFVDTLKGQHGLALQACENKGAEALRRENEAKMELLMLKQSTTPLVVPCATPQGGCCSGGCSSSGGNDIANLTQIVVGFGNRLDGVVAAMGK